MQKTFHVVVMLLSALCAVIGQTVVVQPAQAAPRQIVLVVAEGLNPQLVDFGTAYVKTAFEQGATVAFDELKAQGKAQPAGAEALAGLKGILKTAAANGYKTGLVTTEDVTKTAPLFFDLPEGEGGANSLVQGTTFDIIAGGGRSHFMEAKKAWTDAGNSALFDTEAMDQELKGKTLALQSDAALGYALDRDPDKEASFAELVTLALQALSADDAPFILVVHDTLLTRALAAKDTPAAMEQYRELDAIIADILGTREGLEKPENFGLAVLATGGATVPRFTTELPNERSDAFYILSGLPLSYAKAGLTLEKADEAKLAAFSDPATGKYKGWKLSAENRAALLAGTMTPEAALRASYEPALKISFEPVTAQPMLYTVGLDVAGDLAQTLRMIASAKPAGQ